MTDKSTKVSGYTFDVGTITVTIGSTKYTTTPKKNGDWAVTLPKLLKVSTKVSVTITVKKMPSKARVIVVKPSMPTVNKATTKSKSITGKTYAKAKISINVIGKWKTLIASTKGIFALKLSSALKKGSNFYIKTTYMGLVSELKKVHVY